MKRTFLILIVVMGILVPAGRIIHSQNLPPMVLTSDEEAKTIASVENGLVDAGPIVGNLKLMFDRQRTDTVPKRTLRDQMQAYKIPGVSIAVIRDYRVAWVKGYGVLDSGTTREVTDQTLFQAASTSKVLAALIVLHLAEEGRLDLDSDVNTYLRTWKIPYDTLTGKVTLRLLITHQGGINRPDNGYDREEGSVPTLAQVLKGERPAINESLRFEHPPGTVYKYSNFGYMIIQMVLEDLLNKPYREIVGEYVFKPLEMQSSWMEYPLPPGVAGRLSRPHGKSGSPQDDGLHPTALANAGLITTPSDLAKLTIELMLAAKGRSTGLISQAVTRKMLNKTADVDPLEFSGFSQLGFGVFLIGDSGRSYFFHPGENDAGASCVLGASTTTGDGIVIMTNGAMGLLLSVEIIASVARQYGWDDVR